jgi:hypothetical protein
MPALLASRRPRFVLAAAVLSGLLLALLPLVARADSQFPPPTGPFTLTATVNGTTYTYAPVGAFPNQTGPTISGLDDGDVVEIALTQAPGSGTFSRLRARQCADDRPVNNQTEFNPQIFNRCSAATLGAGSDTAFVDSGPVPPGTTEMDIEFVVGEGTAPDVISAFDGELYPGFDCGPGDPCRLVVNVEATNVPGSSNYLSFPIEFAGAATAPDAPTDVVATAGDGEATVTWDAPASNGGAAIDEYTVTSDPGGQTCVWTTGPLSCTVTGLTNGTAYTFTVVATNSVGDSDPSAPSNSVTPSEAAGNLFTGVTPKRILDSRSGSQVGPFGTPWGPGVTRQVTVAGGTTTVPADAVAVTLNVTATQTNAQSFLSVWPKGEDRPTVSSLNWAPGWTVPNAVTVKVGDDRQVNIYNNLGTVNVVVDVVGYYAEGEGAGFTSVEPERILDSRPASQVGPYNTPWAPMTTRDVTVTGVGGVPADAEAVVLNVTATQTNAVSFLSIWPEGDTQPTVSSLNWDPGWTIPNAVTVKVGTGGVINIYNNLGTANVLVDVVGYFQSGTGFPFHPLSPERILDSRQATQVGPYATPWTAGLTRNLTVTGGTVPAEADAILMNSTITLPSNAVSFLSIWPSGEPRPTVSSLNWDPGWTIANAVTAKVGTGGAVSFYNNLGSVHVISDLAGWYG